MIFEILATLAVGVTTALSQRASNDAAAKAGAESKELAMITRADSLRQGIKDNRRADATLQLQKEGQAFTMKEAQLNRLDNADDRAYNRRLQMASRLETILNSNQQAAAIFSNRLRSRPGMLQTMGRA